MILGSDKEEKRIYEDEALVVVGWKALVPIRTLTPPMPDIPGKSSLNQEKYVHAEKLGK